MSTNFYWAAKTITGSYVVSDDPELHIGKRYSVGGGKLGFTWAQQRLSVVTICTQHRAEEIIIDEYHRPVTGEQFLEMLSKVIKEDTTQIGVWFS
jgi:hypothetical protein